jgi:PAS domain S-box-containing protein
MIRFFLVSILTITYLTTFTQEKGKYFIRNFTPKEYKGHVQNWSLVRNSKGLIYVGNQNGVLEYDGVNWKTIPLPNNSTVRSLAINEGDTVFVGAVDEFGCLRPDEHGKLQYQSYTSLLPDSIEHIGEVWSTSVNSGAPYYMTDNFLYRVSDDTMKIWEPDGDFFFLTLPIGDTLFVQDYESGFKYLDNDSLKLVKNGDVIAELAVHSAHYLRDTIIMMSNPYYGAILYDIKSAEFFIYGAPAVDYMIENKNYTSIQLDKESYAFGTTRGGVIVIDEFGNIKDKFDKSTGLQNDAVYTMLYTNNSNLWIGLEDGVSMIEYNSPITFWDPSTGLKGTPQDIIRFKNKIYVSTGYGVFCLQEFTDKKTSVINKPIEILDIKEQTWQFLHFKNENTEKLLVATTLGIYEIKDTIAEFIYDRESTFSLHQSNKYRNRIWLGFRDGIGAIDFNEENNSWVPIAINTEIKNQIRSIVEDMNGNIWVEALYSGIYKVTNPADINSSEVFKYDTANGLGYDIEYRCYKYNEDILVANATGIHKYNKTSDVFEPYFFNLKQPNDLKSTLLAFDDSGNICVNGSLYLDYNGNGDFDYITEPFLRIPDLTTEALFIEDSGIVWIGNYDGLFRVDLNKEKKYDNPYYTLIRKISINNDSAIFWGDPSSDFLKSEHKFKFKHNELSIEFAAVFFDGEEATEYSHYLEGYYDEWSSWNKETRKEYTNLYEGNYEFKVKAKNVYNKESEIASFKFQIVPPFYRTYVAYVFYLIIIIVIIRLIILIRTRKLINEKKNLEKVVQERTYEINQKKEEIQAQAEHLQDANKSITEKNNLLEKQKKEILRQAQELLENNIELEKLSVIAQETDNGVSVFDKDGNLEWFNEGFSRMYGFTFDEFVKERGKELIKYSHNKNIKEDFEICIKEQKSIIYEFFTLTKDEEGIWAQTTLTPIVNDEGETVKLIAIDANITKIKDAERQILYQKEEIEAKSNLLEQINKELEKLSIVASETDNAIIIMDPKGNIQWINEGFTRMYGYTLDQLITEKDRNIIGASSSLNVKDLIQVWFGDKKPINYESLNTTKAGKKIWAQTTLTPILDENGVIKMLVAIDANITKLKEAEEEIEKQRDELQIANATKDKFFSIIAHDLRGPFSNFVSLIKIILESFEQFDANQLKNYIKEIQNSAQSSYNLLENLLDWSRTQKGDIKYEPIETDVNQIVLENIELLKNIASKKKIQIKYELVDNLVALVDQEMLKTVIRNLISNAIKFTHEGGEVEIQIKEGKIYHLIAVQDNGMGIKKDDINKLFRIDVHHTTTGTRKEKGTGLGLILCKEFVERNGGKIWVDSEIGKGTKFEFTVPIFKIKKSK